MTLLTTSRYQLASKFGTFFDKLIENLESLSEVFPSLEGVEALCAQLHSPRLRSHLEKVYIDLFEFFRSVARVFTSKSHGRASVSLFFRYKC